MSQLYKLLQELIALPSISPKDEGCQKLMLNFLENLGFRTFNFDNPPVANFFAIYGTEAPLLVFAGHTDVVPPGDLDKWKTPPFELVNNAGILYGRGVADMKGSLAAMLIMAKQFLEKFPKFKGSLGFLITSGEEGDDCNLGTPFVMKKLEELGIKVDYCIVGEPSSSETVADIIKIGRRGSLTGSVILRGKQGHVAYPHLASNPIHNLAPVIADLTAITWDKGNEYFPATSFQVTSIKADAGASNIIPGELSLKFNFRFSTEQTYESLSSKVYATFEKYALNPIINWQYNGQPFLTSKGKLLDSVVKAIFDLKDFSPKLSTSGGTSDGRYIAPYGIEVIELGPVNTTIHQINECVSLSDLESLCDIYFKICEELFIYSSPQSAHL